MDGFIFWLTVVVSVVVSESCFSFLTGRRVEKTRVGPLPSFEEQFSQIFRESAAF